MAVFLFDGAKSFCQVNLRSRMWGIREKPVAGCEIPAERAASSHPRCSVSESHGASLTTEQEDALWKDVFMVQPGQRREFEPS